MSFSRVTAWLSTATEFAPELLEGRAVEIMVVQRMRDTGVADEAAYLRRLQTDEQEQERLLEGIAVPETSFFRYPASYEFLAGWLTRRLARKDDTAVLRMASIACATGEEPCSMVITASHARWPLARINVEAVDRNARSLAQARTGRYPARAIARGVPAWARASLERGGEHVHVASGVLARIRYRHANVLELERPPAPGYDVIFCRNLMIYLSGSARRRLIGWLSQALAPDGLLFLGHAEYGPILAARFHPVDPPGAFAFERGAAPQPIEIAPQPPVEVLPRRVVPAARPASPRSPAVPAADDGNGKRLPMRPSPAAPASAASLQAARTLADRGELGPAMVMARRVIERDGPSPAGLELLGSAHLALGELREAHDCFFRAVYLDPDHEGSLLQLALLSERLGDPVQAARYRRRATRAHHGSF